MSSLSARNVRAQSQLARSGTMASIAWTFDNVGLWSVVITNCLSICLSIYLSIYIHRWTSSPSNSTYIILDTYCTYVQMLRLYDFDCALRLIYSHDARAAPRGDQTSSRRTRVVSIDHPFSDRWKILQEKSLVEACKIWWRPGWWRCWNDVEMIEWSTSVCPFSTYPPFHKFCLNCNLRYGCISTWASTPSASIVENMWLSAIGWDMGFSQQLPQRTFISSVLTLL